MNGREKDKTSIVLEGVEPSYRGKIRDIYDLGDRLIVVASDRISAYDSILQTPIPGKGILLNMLSMAWFNWLGDIPHHMISVEVSEYPEPFNRFEDKLSGRSMLVKKAARIDLECIVRGYISGSGWKEYQKTGALCGIRLPSGLVLSQKLENPIFTPSTKADSGHDENISIEKAAGLVGTDTIEKLEKLSLDIYTRACEYAATKDIIIADTKFEFGRVDDEIILIDEVLTPDSSRFWLVDEYQPGRQQESIDKQYVRDWLDKSGWDHEPPAPRLPEEVVSMTLDRYRMAVESLFPEIKIERYFA